MAAPKGTPRRPLRLLAVVVGLVLMGVLTSIGVSWWIALARVRSYTFTSRPSFNIAPEGSPIYMHSMDYADEHRPGFSRFELRAGNGGPAMFDALITHRVAAALEADAGKVDHRARYPADFWARDLVRDPHWPAWMPFPRDDGTQYTLWSARAMGWPQLCMSSRSWAGAATPAHNVSGVAQVFGPSHYAGAPYSGDPDRGCVPLLPIWRGLAINTALFSAAWAVLLVIPITIFRSARAARRRRRGWCIACGYDLRGASPVCPECGVPAP
jgi:hypothetical protein